MSRYMPKANTSVMEQFFADGWFTRLWIFLFTLSAVILALTAFNPLSAALDSAWMIALAVFLAVVSGLLGYLLSLVIGSMFLPSVFRWRERLNGTPFVKGDRVEILRSGHRGVQTIVCEVWADRYEARLEMGQAAQADLSDVFPFTAFKRVTLDGRSDPLIVSSVRT